MQCKSFVLHMACWNPHTGTLMAICEDCCIALANRLKHEQSRNHQICCGKRALGNTDFSTVECLFRTSSSGPPRMVYLSPVTKNRSAASLQTLSPSGRNPISIFGLAQTPGMPAMMGGFPGTPVSDAMTAASWLHDMSLRHPQQVLMQFLCCCSIC